MLFSSGVRSWIPCVDQLQARCFWEMFYTVSDPNMTVSLPYIHMLALISKFLWIRSCHLAI